MGTQRVQMKGVLPWLVRLALHAGTRDFFSALAALVRTEQNIFFLTVNFFNPFVPFDRQAGQAVVMGRLSLSICMSLHGRNLQVISRFIQMGVLLNTMFWQKNALHMMTKTCRTFHFIFKKIR
jgi:hypothetical protein